MTNKILFQAFTENIGGITKGSMNRLIAFLCALTVSTVAIYCTVKNTQIPDGFVAELLTFAGTLLGFSMGSKITDVKTPKP